MSKTSGTRVGAYEILSAIGAGGMGEVYRARDPKLDRHVAIKILPRVFADDPERRMRFEREARALASLNHPNIAHIYGAEETDGAVAIVMELVEGEDLASRIARGAVPLDEALPIARQIAEALEAAHQQGIIHRDLKPANIKLRPDGTVKLLDFGLAKVLDAAASTADPSHTPTITSAEVTNAGVILGTPAYMSPEQARGRPVDKRADIWAFGCILYEMLTGRRAFAGDNPSDVLAAILKEEPKLATLPAGTPLAIRRLVRRCLQKDPAERLRDIGDARLEIRDAEARADSGESAAVAVRPARWREPLAWMVASLMTVAAVWLMLRPGVAPGETRVEIVTPPTASPLSVAISPDGQNLAFVSLSDSESRLWVRSMRSESPRPLLGTEGAESPFWSPDSKSIAFFAEGTLKRIDLSGGSVQTLANASSGTDGSWGARNVILFASRGNPIARVPADRGETTVVEGIKRGNNFSPHFLPDGRRFLYYLRGKPEVRGIYVGDLEGSTTDVRLFDSDSGAVYTSSGHLLYVLKNTLLAQRFDVDRLTVVGEPFGVAEGFAAQSGQLVSPVSVSTTGAIAFRRPSSPDLQQFVWFDRSGKELERLGTPSSTLRQPSLSHDGERVVFYRGFHGNVDIWTMDTKRGAMRPLTSDPGDDVMPVLSPDNTRIIFSSNRTGVLELYWKPISGSGQEELLTSTGTFKVSTDWSRDGRYVLFTAEGAKRSLDIWSLPLAGDRKPFPVVQTADFAELGAQFSPDGNWIAYQSNESGRPEIYIQRFPGPGEKVPVSTNGGSQARWRSDGKEVFYVARNGDLTAVPIEFRSPDRPPVIGTSTKLFTPPIGARGSTGDGRHQYMVSADGQRLLVATSNMPPASPISLILNWSARP